MNNQSFIKKVFGFVVLVITFGFIGSVLLASLNTARYKSTGAPLREGLGVPSFSDNYTSENSVSKTQGLSQVQINDRKIVKNGTLTLLVKKVEEAATIVASTAERMGGFVQSSNVYEGTAGIKSGSVSIRIPSSRFDEVIIELKKSAVEVQRESSDARDVTEQFIDLEARLKNLRAEEEQYQEIMKRAVTIENTLSVASRLHDVRGRIEQIEGQLKYLSSQVDMSVITISLTEEADAQVFGIRWRPLISAKQALHSMFAALAGSFDLILALVIYIPVIVLWLVIAFVIIMIGSRFTKIIRRRLFDDNKDA
ncbi:MAG: DUF4349 domain-containing protein [Patescibacteria group bacterium]